MRPQFFKLPFPSHASFYYSKYDCPYFERPLHFHKEIELVYIIKSKGTKFIGNQIQAFEDGDMTLIGSQIPHLFRNDDIYYSSQPLEQASCIFIHFDSSIFGNFLELPELKKIKNLLAFASQALNITGNIHQQVAQILYEMSTYESAPKIFKLLEILEILASGIDSCKPILNLPFEGKNNFDTDKFNKALDYIIQRYAQEIYLSDIAHEMNMSPAAFSRYFKNHTSKTFSDYVTELRINQACRLLIENNFSVSEIGYMCGFESRANFYRHFKKIMGTMPKSFSKNYLQAVKA